MALCCYKNDCSLPSIAPKRILTSLGSRSHSKYFTLPLSGVSRIQQPVCLLPKFRQPVMFFLQTIFFSSCAKPVFNLIAPLFFDSSPNRNYSTWIAA